MPPRTLPLHETDDALVALLPGHSVAIRALRQQVSGCLASSRPVLITGEDGVGKARVARLMHRLGERQTRPFVVLDARGDVGDRITEVADGTLFLDEIADFSLEMQIELVRRLRAWEVADEPSPRLVAVSCCNLDHASGFDVDLRARLGALRVEVPSLRARRADWPDLCAHLLHDVSGAHVTKEGITYLSKRDWPGNIRQLRDLLHRAAVQNPGVPLTSPLLAVQAEPDALTVPGHGSDGLAEFLAAYLQPFLESGGLAVQDLHARVMAEVERPLFQLILHATEGNQLRAAALLGLNRNTLRKRMRQLDIEPARRSGGR